MKNQASAWLIEKRKAQNLSLRQLGTKTGLSHVTIANAEDGNATTDTWIRLAEYFDESPQVVLGWAEKVDAIPQADAWVLETQRKLSQLAPAQREMAELVIKALIEKEQKAKKK